MVLRKILILAANPRDTEKLRLDEEVREIQEGLKLSKGRDQFEIISRWAVRTEDLRRALLEHEPHIVHFSGHGTGKQGLVLENEIGNVQLVSARALAGLFKLFPSIECVLLNACYSERQAEAIAQHVNYVIGMSQAIGDKAGINFAIGFYDGLGYGRSFGEAFEFGQSAIDLEGISEHLIPVLKKRGDTTSNSTNDEKASEQESATGLPLKASTAELITLETPEGQVPLCSSFYVERPPNELDCYEAIVKPGALVRIKAPRQMGKTSLMTRILHYAAEQGCKTVPLSFQEADGEVFSNLTPFLQWFCASVADILELSNGLAKFGQGILGAKNKCTRYFQKYLLPEINCPLVLGLDEVDQVFQYPKIATDFFGLLRAWHEKAKNELIWQTLRLVIVHSKEVYVPLNINQSPFNVGLPIELPELTSAQVSDLAKRHGVELGNELRVMMAMIGGHPYLVRIALYQMARGRMSLEKLLQIAPTEEGPYNNHLRRHLLNLEENGELLKALRQVVAASQPIQIGSVEAFKLRSMGLVKFCGNEVVPLCDLYRQYFRNRLGTG